MKIYKTINVPVKCSKSDLQYLFNCNRLSAQVWNKCLEIDKKYRENNNGHWIERNEFQKELKGCTKLHSKGIQHVMNKFMEARKAFKVARKQGGRSDMKYPYKNKKHFITGWDKQSIKIDYTKGIIKLSKVKELREDGKLYPVKPIVCHVKSIPQNIVQIECIWKNRLMLSIKYIEEASYLQINSANSASIDLGEIHSITSIDNSGNAIIITGRKLRSISRLRNKEQGKIHKRMSKCKKGSRQYWKYRKAIKSLNEKYRRQMLDAVHKVSKLYLDYCLIHNIKTVYYGDLDSATRGTKQNRFGNKMLRQKLSQWNFGQITKQIENKLARYDIKMVKVKEYYTSQTCPSCKERHKPKGRNYTCKCGYKQHRDMVGAINILNDNAKTELTRYADLKYLQIS